MQSFYAKILRKTGIPKDQSVLVVCGGELDRNTLLEEGFASVTISNLDERMRGDEFAPYAWNFQDAEGLTYPDGSFDYCVVHAGLHHCASPHRALLEMYRVARRGVLAFEARDSLLMRAAVRANKVPLYEACAVRSHGFLYGGVRNTGVPNYIYRWTESEVEKTIASYAPHAPHRIHYYYGLRIPEERLPFAGRPRLRWLPRGAKQLVELSTRVFQKQGNLFAFYIEKPADTVLFPWLKSRTEFDPRYQGI
jgi:ubiquinone/menaquinone biosynthesis C-methylase UbiE